MPNSEEERPKRNIDERIDALSMNQEMQAGLQRDSGARLTAAIAELAQNSKRDAENIRENIRALTTNITRLTAIVEAFAGTVIGHERRITSLEGGQPA